MKGNGKRQGSCVPVHAPIGPEKPIPPRWGSEPSAETSATALKGAVLMDKRSITLRQWFSHTSGIPARDPPCLRDQSASLAQCAVQIVAAPSVASPGT